MNARLAEIEKHIADAKYDDMPEHHKMIQDLFIEIARLRALLASANDRLSEYAEVIVPNLRAEVERLKLVDAANDFTESILERERDEALAQVTVLRKYTRHDPECKINFSKAVQVCTCGLNKVLAGDEARALLDRLQRAGAVIRAVESLIPRGFLNPDGGLEEAFPRHYVDEVRKALAAWEEGT